MTKKILFSPHPVFLNIIKNHFSDKEKYEILGAQDQFVSALMDIDVENVKRLIAPSNIDNKALEYAANIIKESKELPDGFSNNAVFEKFLSKLDVLLYNRLHSMITFLLLLDEEKPDMIVLHNDVEPFMRMLAMWAKENSVPCLHVPHSVIIDSSERSPIGTDIHDILSASHIAVAGEYQKQWYIDRGADENSIYMTGLPQFDKIALTLYNRERSRRVLKIEPGEFIVTYASSWRQDTNLLGCHDGIEQTYVNFLKAAKKLNIRPIIKLHPTNASKQTFDWHMMLIKKIGLHAIVTTQHLYTVLQASDALFSFGPSNILLEGSFYPIHLIATHGYDNDSAVTKVGKEASSDEIFENISQIWNKNVNMDILSQFRYKYIGASLDGQVHVRIAGLIKELLYG